MRKPVIVENTNVYQKFKKVKLKKITLSSS